jgi:hypothetical protein
MVDMLVKHHLQVCIISYWQQGHGQLKQESLLEALLWFGCDSFKED